MSRGINAANLDAAEALYRHQIANDASGGQRNVVLLCLGTGTNPDRLFDPPAALLTRAIVHYVTYLSCASASRCTARGGYLDGNLSASGNRYVLELRNGPWKVTGDTMEWIS